MRVTTATIDLEKQDLEEYYHGYANSTLWPLFHFLLTFFQFSRTQYEAYCRVNQFFARQVRPGDWTVWRGLRLTEDPGEGCFGSGIPDDA